MPRDTTEPVENEHGDQTHPAFGLIAAHRVSSTPGQVLFDSDIRHNRTIRVSVQRATRKRELHSDWVRGEDRDLIVVELSEAQWASFVSSMDTTGVPCTIRATETDWQVPDLPYNPRLAHSMAEVRDAANQAMVKIKEALADVEAAFEAKAGVKVLREKLRNLHIVVENAPSNMAFAAKSLSEHGENVVQRARADIEAIVQAEATRLGLEVGDSRVLELPPLPGEND